MKGFMDLTQVFLMKSKNEPIYKDRIGYHVRAGKHEILFFDWKNYIKYANYVFNK